MTHFTTQKIDIDLYFSDFEVTCPDLTKVHPMMLRQQPVPRATPMRRAEAVPQAPIAPITHTPSSARQDEEQFPTLKRMPSSDAAQLAAGKLQADEAEQVLQLMRMTRSMRLPSPVFPVDDFKKKLNDSDLDQASMELGQLRCQLDHEDYFSTVNMPQKRKPSRLVPFLVSSCVLCTVMYGAIKVLASCPSNQTCSQMARTVEQWRDGVMRSPSPEATPSASGQTNGQADQAGMLAYDTGLQQAHQAAELTQTAVKPHEWKQVVEHWKAAVGAMQSVPKDSPHQAEAAQKLMAYQRNLEYAYSEIDPFREAVNSAMAAAVLTQTAASTQEWQLVTDLWAEAIDLMASVSPDNTRYELAQTKMAEYSTNLSYAQTQFVAVK